MTNLRAKKRRKLSREILGVLAIAAAISLFLFQILNLTAAAIIEHVLFANDIILTRAQQTTADQWVFNLSLLVSVGFFAILYLFLLGERLSYIREVLVGIDALRTGREDYVVPLEGSNELTELAEAVNYLSRTQREVRERERALQEEKEQFIRALSHDIRTPLTSILSYSQVLTEQGAAAPEEQARYLALIRHKAEQIKTMTDILLDGSRRNVEHFENAHLLIEQLVGEFEVMLEDKFAVRTHIHCPAFPGSFDVHELRRIFDNLISNVGKYADPDQPVALSVSLEGAQLVIRQENAVQKAAAPGDSYRLGLRSIQRIAQNYGGQVHVRQDDDTFAITVILSEI